MVFDAATFIVPPTCRSTATFIPPPSNFSDVQWSDQIAPAPARGVRGAKRFGITFERRVSDVLTAIYGRAWRPSPVITYVRAGRRHSAIPDGILMLPREAGAETSTSIIVEVKARHTPLVWPQLMELYLPLVRALEPRTLVRTVEVCWSYDPGVVLPGPHTLIDSLHRPATGLEVLRWKI